MSTTSLVPQNGQLSEEIISINAIYSPNTLTVASSPSPTSTSTTLILALPNHEITFRVSFPPDYPDVKPSIDGTETVHGGGKGEGKWAAGVLRDVLTRVWREGEVCLFDLIEEGGTALATAGDDSRMQPQDGHGDANTMGSTKDEKSIPPEGPDPSSSPPIDGKSAWPSVLEERQPPSSIAKDPPPPPPPPPPQWTVTSPITIQKSVFCAHATPCTSVTLVQSYISSLIESSKRLQSATHNICAWRIRSSSFDPSSRHANLNSNSNSSAQDYDDDGETAAGGRLLHLMQLMDVWDAVVVVSRWYGGVKLGPDRFRIINGCARDALVQGGFVKGKEKDSGKGKTKGKKG